MANGFGSLYIGASGLISSQNALNVTANNLANVDTAGYVRQRLLFGDRDYVTLNSKPAIAKFQTGLGVSIADVVHSRDIFLDRLYRTNSSRRSFYASSYEAASEVETQFQELEGMAFQDAQKDLWESLEEFYKGPDAEEREDLVVQKAYLYLSRANAVYDGLKSYQYNLNTQISEDIDRINDLGDVINELNQQIAAIEAGDIETAMTLRDTRDLALDELSSLIDIDYKEDAYGIVTVTAEGNEFVTADRYYEIGKRVDDVTGFITPYWTQLSNPTREKYVDVFSFRENISAENQNDGGELKALLMARGDHAATYQDVSGRDRRTYDATTGKSVMLKAESELDQLVHGIVTAINDTICPNKSAEDLVNLYGDVATGQLEVFMNGERVMIDANTKILDEENCMTGSDGKLPPQELFSRRGTERYSKATFTVTLDDGTQQQMTCYVYNEEDPFDTSKQYTLGSLSVNQALVEDETLLPHFKKDGSVGYDVATRLAEIWDEERLTLNPNDTKPCSFGEYYGMMTGEMAILGNVYGETASELDGATLSIDNSRQQVIGVSSDEELTNMIKFQSAYNASSRFINVVDEMIEHLLTQLG